MGTLCVSRCCIGDGWERKKRALAFFRRLNGGGLDLASATDMLAFDSRSMLVGPIAVEMQSRSDLRSPIQSSHPNKSFVIIEREKHVA